MQTPIREIMATTSKDTSIRIKESTRFRLDMLKGNKSHDAFVAEMLLYFETTGITPQSNVMPPNIAAKEQASRVIEVVRGIEKSTNVRLKNIEQLLLSLVGEVKNAGGQSGRIYAHLTGTGTFGAFQATGTGSQGKPGEGRETANGSRNSPAGERNSGRRMQYAQDPGDRGAYRRGEEDTDIQRYGL